MAREKTSSHDDISALKEELRTAAELEAKPAGLRTEGEGVGGGDRVRAAEGISFFQGLTPRDGDETKGNANGERDPWLAEQLKRIQAGTFTESSVTSRRRGLPGAMPWRRSG
jgi:hypothetical protein